MIRTLLAILFPLLLAAGCAAPLITDPVDLPGGKLDMSLQSLTRGPDQYSTAGGYWRPRKGIRFFWATVIIRNGHETPILVRLKDIHLISGGKRVRPFIIDMGSAVTMRANPEPGLRPGETIKRRLVYKMSVGDSPEKIVYDEREADLPVQAPSSGDTSRKSK